jgi:hypothetical protein
MLKKWFPFSFHEELATNGGAFRNGSAHHGVAVHEPDTESNPPTETPKLSSNGSSAAPAATKYVSFKQIYQGSSVRPPRLPEGILKVAEMVNSQHLAGMTPEAKRCSLLMALEASGVEVEELLQDAVLRQKALNDYEEVQLSRLREFESVKADENSKIQAELDRLTGQYMSRIQANLNEVAREQDALRAWQQQKQHESQRIAEAATFCVPHGAGTSNNGLTVVLERATLVRR